MHKDIPKHSMHIRRLNKVISLTAICYENSNSWTHRSEQKLWLKFCLPRTYIDGLNGSDSVHNFFKFPSYFAWKKATARLNKMHLITFSLREKENNKTHNSLLLTGSFSCWRKWWTRSIFFTLPLFFTKNSRTEAWVIPSFADMLNLCGTGWISPSLLSEIPMNTDDIFRRHHNYVQMHAGSSWSPRTSRGRRTTWPQCVYWPSVWPSIKRRTRNMEHGTWNVKKLR